MLSSDTILQKKSRQNDFLVGAAWKRLLRILIPATKVEYPFVCKNEEARNQ